MVSLTPHSHEKTLAPKHHLLTTFPAMLPGAAVDSFRNNLEELVAPIGSLGYQIVLLTFIQYQYLQGATPTMDADLLRMIYLQCFGMPEKAIPAEAIARLFKLRVPHHKDHINAIKKFIANLNSLSKRDV
jgi:hypothetical protein